jgi:hypothetical protein
MGQLLTKSLHDNEETSPNTEVEEFNSAISPHKHRMQLTTKITYPLGPTARHSLQVCTSAKLQEVLRFFCLDLGCQHARGEAYLSTGTIDGHEVALEDRCDDAGSICTKKWNEQFLPVYRSGVVAFLEYLRQIGRMPQDMDYKSPILSLLAGSPFWKETVFYCAAS